jgi:sec-independent protein translocase protein TatA
MMDYLLNIIGSEWLIIIFVALVLILGTNQLPEAARKFGKIVNEFNRAKNEVQNQMNNITTQSLDITKPVDTERQKLEKIADSLGINFAEKSDIELQRMISEKLDQRNNNSKQ